MKFRKMKFGSHVITHTSETSTVAGKLSIKKKVGGSRRGFAVDSLRKLRFNEKREWLKK